MAEIEIKSIPKREAGMAWLPIRCDFLGTGNSSKLELLRSADTV